jgi:hypothetical protein
MDVPTAHRMNISFRYSWHCIVFGRYLRHSGKCKSSTESKSRHATSDYNRGAASNGGHKLYGGRLKSSVDGPIYGIPQRANCVIKASPRTQEATTITSDQGLPEGLEKSDLEKKETGMLNVCLWK